MTRTAILILLMLLGATSAQAWLIQTPAASGPSCSAPFSVVSSDCVAFLTSGTSLAVPANWNNAANSIKAIGGGGGAAGGGVASGTGGAGGLYGGGGGGSGFFSGVAGGPGAAGIIVVTYTP